MRSWLRNVFTAPVPECDKARYAKTQRELEEARGQLRGAVQNSKSNTSRLRLMEDALALKESYDGASGR